MRNLYIKKPFRGFMQMFTLTVIFVFIASLTFAQTDMTWTGAENDRFDNENNWEPAGSIVGNTLIVPLQYDSLGNQLFPTPKLTGSTDYEVNDLVITYDKDTSLNASVIIELDSDDVLFKTNNRKIQYNSSGLIINRGHVFFRTQRRLQDTSETFIINGGVVDMEQYYIIRNGNDMNSGGHVTISGGELNLLGGFHDRVNKTRNQFTITGDGVLNVAGNYGSDIDDIESGWISGGEDYNVVRAYDAVTNITTYSAVSAASFLVSNADRQVVIANQPGDTLRMIPTPLITNAKSISWKYRKDGETSFTAFANSSTDAFAPTFTEQGIYFVICEGVSANDQTYQSQEVEFFVGSDAISFAPFFPLQYYRQGETGAKIAATVSGASSIEWKYATTPDGPYQSFDTPVTTNEITPMFTETGNHYIVLEATVGGTLHTSYEMLYVIEDSSSTGKDISWTGLVSEDAFYPSNWSPVAYSRYNNLVVNAFDSLSTLPYPIFSAETNDTIRYLYVQEGANATIAMGTDTLNVRSDCYINGDLNVESGVFTSMNSYFRITSEAGVVTLSNDAVMWVRSFILSDNKGHGGNVYLKDNSKFYNFEEMPWRQSADTLESVTYIQDKAVMYYKGDQRTTVKGWIETGKIVCPDEGFEPMVLFDSQDSLTFVQARDMSAFAIENDIKTYTTANVEPEEPITLTNVDGVTSWEWKWSNNVTGPWVSFDPAVTDEANFYPSFSESGTYYIVAETSDGILTSNMKTLVVIDLAIDPADEQKIEIGAEGDTLFAVIPEEFSVSSIAWFYLIPGNPEPQLTGIEDTLYVPTFEMEGIYDILYIVEVQDEYGSQYWLWSNTVRVNVGNVNVNTISLETLKVYPNPSSGKFYIDGNFDGEYTLEIMDLAGSVVLKKRYTGHQAINCPNKGAFIIKMTSDNEIKTGRLIVK